MSVRDLARKNADKFTTTELAAVLHPELGELTADIASKRKKSGKTIGRLCKEGHLEAEKVERRWVIYASGKTIRGLKDNESQLGISAEDIEERMAPAFRNFQDRCGRDRRKKERERRDQRIAEAERARIRLGDLNTNAEVLQKAKKEARKAPKSPKNRNNRDAIRHKSTQGNNASNVNPGVVQQPVVGVPMTTVQGQQTAPNFQQLIADNAAAIKQNESGIAANATAVGKNHKQIASINSSIKTINDDIANVHQALEEGANLMQNQGKKIEIHGKQLDRLTQSAFLSLSPQKQQMAVAFINNEELVGNLIKQGGNDDLNAISSTSLKERMAEVMKAEIQSIQNTKLEDRSELAKLLKPQRPLWQKVAIGAGYTLVGVSTAVVLFEIIAAVAGFSGLLIKRGGKHAAAQLDLAATWNSEHNPNYAQ